MTIAPAEGTSAPALSPSVELSVPEQPAVALGDNPIEGEPARIETPHAIAAGIPAILNTAKYGLRAMGPLKAAQAFLTVNQADGYDCQGCAWPSPDKRKLFEFCENGAKAISDELTHRTIGPAQPTAGSH